MLTGPLPKQVDHRKLAEQRAELEGTIPVVEFKRLGEGLASTSGEIHVRLKFRQGKKHRTLVLGECAGEVEVICQACLEPMTLEIHATIRTLLVPSLDELMALGQGEDGMVCETELISLVELVEDELIVDLPMVARHEGAPCVPVESTAEPEKDTYKPFAGLAQLKEEFKRS